MLHFSSSFCPVPGWTSWEPTSGSGNPSRNSRRSLVILFDTTCPDCHRQLPQVQAAYDALGDKVNVLAVSRKDVPDAVSEFWAANGFSLPVATSKGPDIYQAFDRGSKSGVPQLYLCNPGGIVLFYSGDERVTTTTEIVREISDFI